MSQRDSSSEDRLFHPKIGGRLVHDRDRVPFLGQIARLVSRQGGRRVHMGKAARVGRVAVRAPRALSRRCVIKARYVPLTSRGMKAARMHLAYLERDGVERDGSAGRFYGADGGFSDEAIRAPLDGEQRQFRFIVSPEEGGEVDLREFTRELMKRVEKDVGRRLTWAAVNHHNTDNPHVHIVVRGVDKDGEDVRIDGRYIGREMRWRAQEVLTRELGPRSELDLSRQVPVDIGRDRWTEVDRMLGEHAGAEGIVAVAKLLAAPGAEGRLCIRRLQYLEGLDLASPEGARTWRLADGWKESLIGLGEREEMMNRLVPLFGERAAGYEILDPRIPCPLVEGVVAGKGLDDELTGRMFVAVKTTSDRSFYVRLAPEVAALLQRGEEVRVGVEVVPWLRPADQIIDRAASENGGIYDPVRHQRALEMLSAGRREPDQVSAAERVTANVRRLERLARYGLVQPLPDGRWQVRPDLVSQLQDRERTHPQTRVRMERRVPERTADVAHTRGPEDSERANVGQALAKQLHMKYVSDPATFKGRLMECTVAPSGREFASVVDHARGEFTLIPKPPEWFRVHGRTVHLTRDREQKLVMQRDLGISR